MHVMQQTAFVQMNKYANIFKKYKMPARFKLRKHVEMQ